MASVKYTCRPEWEVFEQVPGFPSSLLSNMLSNAQSWAGSIRCYHPPPATYSCWASQTQESLPWTSQSISYSESAFSGFHEISWMSIKCRTWAARACKRSPGLHQRRGKQRVHNGGNKRRMGLVSIFIGRLRGSVTDKAMGPQYVLILCLNMFWEMYSSLETTLRRLLSKEFILFHDYMETRCHRNPIRKESVFSSIKRPNRNEHLSRLSPIFISSSIP